MDRKDIANMLRNIAVGLDADADNVPNKLAEVHHWRDVEHDGKPDIQCLGTTLILSQVVIGEERLKAIDEILAPLHAARLDAMQPAAA